MKLRWPRPDQSATQVICPANVASANTCFATVLAHHGRTASPPPTSILGELLTVLKLAVATAADDVRLELR